MESLTNTIEAILFASGNAVPLALITEKLGITKKQTEAAIEELKARYSDESGLLLLLFNGKAQLSTNPIYKDAVSAVLNPIKEKEFTKTILECAAIIAYKQPITKAELEAIRGVSSDYAIRTLLELEMIEVQGRKDAVGKPILYGTTDNFLKRFRLTSLEELPDYETLMQSIHLSNDEETYLYAKEDFDPAASTEEEKKEELPDFLKDLGEEDLIRIGTDDEAS